MYTPPKKILEKYADVLVNFALGNGKGIKKGDVVYVSMYEYAKPLYVEILKKITRAGGNVISHYMPNSDKTFDITRDFFVNAKMHQITHFPSKYFKGLFEEADHYLLVLSETDMEALKGIDPKKIMARKHTLGKIRTLRDEKMKKKRLSRSIALYGTEATAKEVGMSKKAYWNQIIKACFLDKKNPIAEWKKTEHKLKTISKKLNKLNIQKLHVSGPDVDLYITVGKKRRWLSGGGENIPSFEVFTSPDWRGTEGRIRFNNPVYMDGTLIKGIELEFKRGVVVSACAKKNEKLLKKFISIPGGNKVGEFSLTDKRLSRITKFMAETLYDENVGGLNGNMHIALGKALLENYDGDIAKLKKSDLKKLGFNDSTLHQDIVSTVPRTVTAYLAGGKEKIIYKNGMFCV